MNFDHMIQHITMMSYTSRQHSKYRVQQMQSQKMCIKYRAPET